MCTWKPYNYNTVTVTILKADYEYTVDPVDSYTYIAIYRCTVFM